MAAVLPAVDQQFDREPAAKEQTRSNMEYTLAKPTAEEYHAVAALKGAAFAEKNFCFGQCCGEEGVKLRTEAFAEWESSNPAKLDHLRIIRGDSGEIVGACQLQIGDDPGDPELESVGMGHELSTGEAYVEWIACAPGATGKGIGSKLLKWADECAKENGATFLSLEVMSANVGGIRLYERKGYVITKDPNACAMSAAVTTPSHASDGAAAPHPHPVPPPVPGRPYEQVGSIDVLTMESTIFWWKNKTYVLENIGCGYADHAGKWFPEFKGHSYARVRDFSTGVVVDNISSSIGFGFLNAFPDYDHNRLWLFGTPADRCHGNCGACSGASCPGRPSCTSIQAWWTSLAIPTTFETAVAIPAGTKELSHTYNQGVARVRVPGPGMPEHGYIMISEPHNFFINNDPAGNLTAAGAGWTLAPNQKAPPGAGGGVSMQWAADETDASKPGYYYSVTGGSSVGFARSRDLLQWEPYHVVMSQQAGQYQIAPYAGFAASAARKGFVNMSAHANWKLWGWDNNDGDLCCADQPAAITAGHGKSPYGWLVWGASTQGSQCRLAECSTNAIGRFSNMSLPAMMASFF